VVSTVVAIRRYPLKSASGEELHSVDVESDGLRADRMWACLDLADGTVGSAKHPGRWSRLLEVDTRVDGHQAAIGIAGTWSVAGSPHAEALLSAHVGRHVRMTRVVPERATLHRQLPDDAGLVPDWMTSAAGSELVTDISGARPGGRFVDFGAVHLVTSGALAALANQLGRPAVEAARFRPNLVLDAARDPAPGQELHIGEVILRVVLPTPRCVVPGLDPDGVSPVDRPLLRALAQHHRAQVGDVGRAACFGVYAEVLRPGRIAVGQGLL